jgi:hypothetical protein
MLFSSLLSVFIAIPYHCSKREFGLFKHQLRNNRLWPVNPIRHFESIVPNINCDQSAFLFRQPAEQMNTDVNAADRSIIANETVRDDDWIFQSARPGELAEDADPDVAGI